MAAVTLKTTGTHCPSCSMLIKMNLEDIDGVESADSDFASGETKVVYDAGRVTPDQLVQAVVAAGYGAEVAD